MRYNADKEVRKMSKQNDKFNEVLKLFKSIPKDMFDSVVDEIYNKLSCFETQVDNSVYSFTTEKVVACKNCGSVHIVKNGKDRHGHTRYLCRDCNTTFGDMTGTTVSGTHKAASVWQEYIRNLIQGRSLAECAESCNISVPTAFVWRHKILNALSESSFSNYFTGMVEMDEMYVRISYKGNHSKSKHFAMPRAPFKRGSDNRSDKNSTKVCVLCVVERNKVFSGVIPCRGLVNTHLLQNLFENKLSDESIVLTDGCRAYNQYFSTAGIEHVVLEKNGKKPAVKGPYHINTVNALHSRFRKFLQGYNGVSTKYLKNYLALFLWLENNKYRDKEALLNDELSRVGSYISSVDLGCFEPIPALAPAA